MFRIKTNRSQIQMTKAWMAQTPRGHQTGLNDGTLLWANSQLHLRPLQWTQKMKDLLLPTAVWKMTMGGMPTTQNGMCFQRVSNVFKGTKGKLFAITTILFNRRFSTVSIQECFFQRFLILSDNDLKGYV